jgi:hypothetical protein
MQISERLQHSAERGLLPEIAPGGIVIFQQSMKQEEFRNNFRRKPLASSSAVDQ